MNKLSNKLYKIVTNRVLLVSIIIFVVFIAAVAVPVAGYTEKATHSDASPDTSFDYDAEDLFSMAESYGADGRHAYIVLRFTFDLVFPFVYLFFMTSLLTKLLADIPKKLRLSCFNLLPLTGFLFDLTENSFAAYVMAVYPKKAYIAATIASYATMLKWILLGVSFVLIAVFLIYKIIFLFKKKAAD